MRIVTFLTVALSVSTAIAQSYQIQPLPSLDGHVEAHAMGINNLGQIVGYSVDPSFNSHAVIWNAGVVTELPYISNDNKISEAYRINNSGQIVGKARTQSNATHAAYWDANGVIDIGTLGGATSFANDINEAGVVAGSSDATLGSVAFTWTQSGGFVNYGNFNPASPLSRAGFNGINDTGDIVGTAYTLFNPFKAMKARAGVLSITEISPPGQFSTGMALAVNDAGTIVGFQNPGSGSATAAIFNDNGTITDLGALGLTDSFANDINGAGLIVGEAFGDDGSGNFLAKSFVWENGVMTDLMTLIDANSGWTELFEAKGVNDLGQIVGAGIYNGEFRAFVMTPVPEPAALFALAAIGLVGRRRSVRSR